MTKPKKYIYTSSGKPYLGWIDRDLAKAKQRIKENKPCAILIVAPPGRGKTTLAVHIAENFSGNKCIFEKQLGNGFEDFNKKLQITRALNLDEVIYDEGGDVDKRRWMSDTNYKIRRILQLYRGFKKLLILCIQDFSLLDESVLNTEVIQYMYYIDDRNMSYAKYRCYSLSRMYFVLFKMSKIKNKNMAFELVRPNYRGTFFDLLPERAKELEEYSLMAKRNLLDDLSPDEEGLLDRKALAENIGKSVVWITRAIKYCNVAPAKIKNKKYFYDESVIEVLSGYVDEGWKTLGSKKEVGNEKTN